MVLPKPTLLLSMADQGTKSGGSYFPFATRALLTKRVFTHKGHRQHNAYLCRRHLHPSHRHSTNSSALVVTGLCGPA